MMMESVKEQILKIFKSTHIGTMTTISGGKPFSRYMTFQNKDFVLYTVTEKNSDKVDDLLEIFCMAMKVKALGTHSSK